MDPKDYLGIHFSHHEQCIEAGLLERSHEALFQRRGSILRHLVEPESISLIITNYSMNIERSIRIY
jgi:hypothetical protein